jgi:PKD repeat protein
MKFILSVGLTAIFLFLGKPDGYGQKNYATNVKTEISDDKMLITYDAPALDGAPYYSIILMVTYNGKAVQANSMFGDYGNKVEPGMEKAITWYYTNDFSEDIRKVSVSLFAYKVDEPRVYFNIVSKSNNGFAPCEVRVSNGSSNVNEYKWDFNDPQSGIHNYSTEKEPVHVYERAGIYNITLIGRNSLLGLEGISYNTVEVKEHEPTVADFSFIVTGNKPPYKVKFQNTSKNGEVVTWNFGDPAAGAKNNTSDKPNPVYKYKKAGTYVVELTAKSLVSGLTDKIKKEVTLQVPVNPVAGFVFSLSQESAPAIAQFKNTSTNSDSYKWNFGDPGSGAANTSSDTDPVHIYQKEGKYEVVLTATASQTGKTHRFSEFVMVLGPPKPPVAGFKITNNNAIGPVTVSFTNTSTDADLFTWDFGDPESGTKNTSSDKSPIHNYTIPGKYAVVLKAFSSKTNQSDQFIDYVNVLEAAKPPVASFSVNNDHSPAPATISFTNSSLYSTGYTWDFGDPGSGTSNKSSELNPSHTYGKAGSYKVSLTARNSAGAMSTIIQNVTVTEAVKPVRAQFSIENNNETAPVIVRFRNASANASGYNWDFGDHDSGDNTSLEANPTHRYLKPGRYSVKLTAKGPSGNQDVFTQEVVVKETPKLPVAGFTVENNNAIAPALIRFRNTSTNATSYLWNFGDVSSSRNTSSDENPSHTYTKAGNYKAVLTAKNNEGVVSTWSADVIVVEPEKPPVAKFSVENNQLPSPANVRFRNTSSNAVEYSWNFGDPASAGNVSAELHPSHIYASPGTYQVTLTAKNNSGNTSTWTEKVVITEPEILPVARFIIENNNVYSPANIRFTNTSANATGYTWNFGDPSSGAVNQSTDSNPVHTYAIPGRYEVKLTAFNNKGSSHVFTDYVTILAPPSPPVARFTIENNNVIGPATISFSNHSENAVAYRWDFGDPGSGDKNVSTETNPVHTYIKPGKYTVKLTASETSTGQRHEAEMQVTIQEPVLSPVADFSFAFSGQFAPLDVAFTNLSVHADTYKWSFGDSRSPVNESTGTNPVHRYEKPGTYTITLEAKSSRSGKSHVSIKEITISEKYVTFLKTFGKRGVDEVATSLVQTGEGEYAALINEQKTGSTIVMFDRKGDRFTEKKLNSSMYDLVAFPGNKGYVLAGINHPGDLIVQVADKKMNPGNPVMVYSNVFDPGYKFTNLHAAVSEKGDEIGIVANLVNDAGECNIWFQKAEISGKPMVARGKTFKYVGFKTANQVIATRSGEFAVIGGYQQDINSPGEMMLGMVGSDGTGKIHPMRARQKLTGCDLIELPSGNFEVLAARESPVNPDFHELSLKLVDREINPMNCEIDLVGLMRSSDFKLFPPRLLETEEGFILLSHVYNGTDSDIALLWIDKAGSVLLRKEEIKRPGDQFGTALLRESDGSLVITGSERITGDLDAILIKTDRMGRYNDQENN